MGIETFHICELGQDNCQFFFYILHLWKPSVVSAYPYKGLLLLCESVLSVVYLMFSHVLPFIAARESVLTLVLCWFS